MGEPFIDRFKRLLIQSYESNEGIENNHLWEVSYGLEQKLDPDNTELVMAYLYATKLPNYFGSNYRNFLLGAFYDLKCTDFCEDLKELTKENRGIRRELIAEGEALFGKPLNIEK